MAQNTTVQFRMETSIKEGAYAVFDELGISPSEAVRVFFKQVQKTRTLPFILIADEQSAHIPTESSYQEWLRERLATTLQKLDSGEMPSYTTDTAKSVLQKRLAQRRKSSAA